MGTSITMVKSEPGKTLTMGTKDARNVTDEEAPNAFNARRTVDTRCGRIATPSSILAMRDFGMAREAKRSINRETDPDTDKMNNDVPISVKFGRSSLTPIYAIKTPKTARKTIPATAIGVTSGLFIVHHPAPASHFAPFHTDFPISQAVSLTASPPSLIA